MRRRSPRFVAGLLILGGSGLWAQPTSSPTGERVAESRRTAITDSVDFVQLRVIPAGNPKEFRLQIGRRTDL